MHSACIQQNRASRLLSIPPELIEHIGQFATKRYDYRRKINARNNGETLLANADLTSLASTCRALRTLLFGLLFAQINLGSSSRLRSFVSAPQHILALVRSLSIRLDLPLFESWIHDLRSYARHDHLAPGLPSLHASHTPALSSHDSSNLVRVLALILVRTSSSLQRFAFVMQPRHWGDGGWGSAWSQFPQVGMASLDWSKMLVSDMRDLHAEEAERTAREESESQLSRENKGKGAERLGPSFPKLRYLCVDGTADVFGFVAIAPGLHTLRLRIPEGFNTPDSRSIIGRSLPCLPGLKELEMWIWELGQDTEERTELLSKMAMACPDLEKLSFQTRTFDYADGGMALRPVDPRRFDWQDLVTVLPQFPSLVELRLPGSLYEVNEQRAFHRNRILIASSTTNVGTSGLGLGLGLGSIAPVQLLWHAAVSLVKWVRGTPSSTRMAPLAPAHHSIIPPPPHTHTRSSSASSTVSATSSFLDSLEETISTRERITSAQLIRHSPSSKLQLVSWVRDEGEDSVDYFLDPEFDHVVRTYKSGLESKIEADEYKSYDADDDEYEGGVVVRCYSDRDRALRRRLRTGSSTFFSSYAAESFINAIPALILIMFTTLLPIPLWLIGIASGVFFSARGVALAGQGLDSHFVGRSEGDDGMSISSVSTHAGFAFDSFMPGVKTIVAVLLLVELLTWSIVAGCLVSSGVAFARSLVIA
ncbi:hypothetical protein FRB95_006476 [Tulasnella sp. JGI-2019a]|nr:hypothetical protein FRB93_009126 [Tulasnella sp. JGI-2019a]KAG9037223.1 hypothetical protein FRB95_006476 [Tulasnella sp. JGI-2019a]